MYQYFEGMPVGFAARLDVDHVGQGEVHGVQCEELG